MKRSDEMLARLPDVPPEFRDEFIDHISVALAREAVEECRRCPLSESTSPVPWSGPPGAEFVMVGEAPGAEEERRGEPFVGRAGRLLRRCLAQAGIDESRVAFVNVVSCRPPQNRFADAETVDAPARCRVHFDRALTVSRGWAVALLGRQAQKAVFPADPGVGARRGSLRWKDGRLYLVSWHPAYALRNPSAVDTLTADLAKLRCAVDGDDRQWTGSELGAAQFAALGRVELTAADREKLEKHFRRHGWVMVHSPVLGRRVVIVRSQGVRVPDWGGEEPVRFTAAEVVKVSSWGAGWLRRVAWVKAELGAEVVG